MLWIFWHLLLSGSLFSQNQAEARKDESIVKYPIYPTQLPPPPPRATLHTETHLHTCTVPCSPHSSNQRGSRINGSCSRGSSVQYAKITVWCRQTQPEILLILHHPRPPTLPPLKSMHSWLLQVASSSRLFSFFCESFVRLYLPMIRDGTQCSSHCHNN